jgi:hypothetical protein
VGRAPSSARDRASRRVHAVAEHRRVVVAASARRMRDGQRWGSILTRHSGVPSQGCGAAASRRPYTPVIHRSSMCDAATWSAHGRGAATATARHVRPRGRPTRAPSDKPPLAYARPTGTPARPRTRGPAHDRAGSRPGRDGRPAQLSRQPGLGERQDSDKRCRPHKGHGRAATRAYDAMKDQLDLRRRIHSHPELQGGVKG